MMAKFKIKVKLGCVDVNSFSLPLKKSFKDFINIKLNYLIQFRNRVLYLGDLAPPLLMGGTFSGRFNYWYLTRNNEQINFRCFQAEFYLKNV